MDEVGASQRLVLVTGGTGFVGTALCAALSSAGYRVRRAVRASSSSHSSDAVVGNIDGDTAWKEPLDRVDTVVHLAARAHVIDYHAEDPLAAYRRINVDATRNLFDQAIEAEVRRFIFMSSIKVNGEETLNAPFREADTPRPQDAYGITKLEAEQLLHARARRSNVELVTLRPPLVYGPGAKGNLLRLMRLLARGIPLPVGSIKNRRSLIGVANLADAIVACVRSPQAAGRTYLVSDGEDLSTPALVAMLAAALNVKTRLIRCPVALLEAASALTGKTAEVRRLTRSLEVDSSSIRRELAWNPPHPMARGLAEMGRWYNSQFCARAIAE
ncbi:MAG: NAD-dependent epimerase/dehydratase family protein [Burkholderiales bacterium]